MTRRDLYNVRRFLTDLGDYEKAPELMDADRRASVDRIMAVVNKEADDA